MTIEEMQDYKKATEMAIASELREFSEQTGLTDYDLKLNFIDVGTHDDPEARIINYVKLDVKL